MVITLKLNLHTNLHLIAKQTCKFTCICMQVAKQSNFKATKDVQSVALTCVGWQNGEKLVLVFPTKVNTSQCYCTQVLAK